MKLWSCLPVVVLLASCSLFGKKEVKKKDVTDKTRLVGRVASLPAEGGFALIESYGPWTVPTGGLLSSAGEGRGATLTVSGEKVDRFAAADIKAGTLQPGDAVFYRPPMDSSDETDPEAKTESSAATPENSKKNAPEVPKS